jgi:hypothetical protein
VRESARRLVETAAACYRHWRRPTPAAAASAGFLETNDLRRRLRR